MHTDDESFQGGEASDVAEEFDSNASSSNSDSEYVPMLRESEREIEREIERKCVFERERE